MTAEDARKRGEADTPDERRGRCRSAALALGSRCRGCYPAKLTQRAPERSVEHTSERLKAKAPQPTPTQGDGLEEDGAQVRQRATHRQRRLFVRASDGETRRWSAGRKPRCDRHGHEEPGSRADRTERRGTVAAGRIGQRSRCDAGNTEATADRKERRKYRRHRAAETTGTDAAMRTGRTPPRGNQPATPARRSWTRTHGREAKGQGLARPLDRGAHGSLRSDGNDQTRAKRTHERAGRVAALRAAESGKPADVEVANNLTCASRGMALRASWSGAPRKKAAAEHLSGAQTVGQGVAEPARVLNARRRPATGVGKRRRSRRRQCHSSQAVLEHRVRNRQRGRERTSAGMPGESGRRGPLEAKRRATCDDGPG